MAFFSLFPRNPDLTTNLLASVRFEDLTTGLQVPYGYYRVQNGERPDQISSKIYGSPDYVWILLLANGLTLGDWPMSEETMQQHLLNTYGDIATAQQPAVWLDGWGNAMDQTSWDLSEDPLKTTASLYDAELQRNDQHILLRVPDAAFVGTLQQRLRSLLGQSGQ